MLKYPTAVLLLLLATLLLKAIPGHASDQGRVLSLAGGAITGRPAQGQAVAVAGESKSRSPGQGQAFAAGGDATPGRLVEARSPGQGQALAAGLDWQKYQAGVAADWDEHQKAELGLWQAYRERIGVKWGKQAQLPEKKTYAEYFSNDQVRVRIDFEKGIITVESLEQSVAESKKSTTLALDHLLKEKVIEKAELPTHPGGVITSGEVLGGDQKKRELRSFTFKMKDDHLAVRIRRYLPLVLKYAALYDIDPAFVLAVIEQESAFNPRARSWAPAYGLMQIVPVYAGQEVLHEVPTEEYLYDPENNIRVGTAYLKLLEAEYFGALSASTQKQYLVTCSYNWGPHRIKKAIDSGRVDPKSRAEELYDNLMRVIPAETKGYLRGVSGAYKKFRTQFMEKVSESDSPKGSQAYGAKWIKSQMRESPNAPVLLAAQTSWLPALAGVRFRTPLN